MRRRNGVAIFVLAAVLTSGCAASSTIAPSETTSAAAVSPTSRADTLPVVTPSALVIDGEQPAGEAGATRPKADAQTNTVDPAAGGDGSPVPVAPTPVATQWYRPGAAAVAIPGGALSGRRVGLIANAASTVEAVAGADGLSTIDLLASLPDLELAAIFAPEHGPRGDLEAGAAVPDGIDAATGVRVHSLYGDTQAPTAAMLGDVDVLVYDLQGVGARFYTFISTLGLAMQAANDAGLPFVVLDRPNPLGGTLVSGPTLEAGFESFVGQYPIPSVHGLTAGELAQAMVGESWLPGLDGIDLRVVRMQGWVRASSWADLGATWVPPSPGLPTFEAARSYPGTVLFEATSISYGRGTDRVFEQIGAPWIDAARLVSDLASMELTGVRFEPVSFVPQLGTLATAPAHAGLEVHGVWWRVTDPTSFDPVVAGIAVLAALREQAREAGVALIERPDFFDLLAGTDAVRLALAADDELALIVSRWEAEAERFVDRMQPYLLYD